MPTIPARSGDPHRAREAAESFGADPASYHRTRPRYPQELVDAVLARTAGREFLDVGIGTGVSADPFRATGCRVLGVEVDPRMAQFARQRGFEVEIARFEDWDPAGRPFDTIIAGTTWHWVDPHAGAAKAAAALRAYGQIALFWNVARPPIELARAFSTVYQRVLPATPFATPATDPLTTYSPILTNTVDGLREAGAFTEPERWQFDWERDYTREQWLEQVPTFGGHSRFPPAKLDELLAGIAAAIDAAGGSFTMPYATVAITASRRPGQD
ncbi:MAG: class I SAM-dependent methyltransferase [Actinobacteria bacterium]|nr:class I SAM-dependent methyltransferase [Actinomycetota bacterium]